MAAGEEGFGVQVLVVQFREVLYGPCELDDCLKFNPSLLIPHFFNPTRQLLWVKVVGRKYKMKKLLLRNQQEFPVKTNLCIN